MGYVIYKIHLGKGRLGTCQRDGQLFSKVGKLGSFEICITIKSILSYVSRCFQHLECFQLQLTENLTLTILNNKGIY